MVKIGVVGVGHMGKIHARLLKENPLFELVGVYDNNFSEAQAVAQTHGVKAFETYDDLLNEVDAVDVVTPTTTHFQVASQAIRQSKHLFIEKPLTETLDEARQLVELAREADIIAQVGHVERFNPAFIAASERPLNPMFIESHRLANWNPRGADVSVVLDLMIHDLDIILTIVPSTVKSVSASGVAVISDTPDIANARIVFHNGAVANLTASRISMKNMRKMRLFQKNAYVTIDFLDRKTEVYEIFDGDQTPAGRNGMVFELGDKKKTLALDLPEIASNNAIQMELESFARAIEEGKEPPISLYDAYRILETATQIIEKMTPARV